MNEWVGFVDGSDRCISIDVDGDVPKTYASGTCPKCGDDGEWRSLALVCRNGHGVFAG